MNKSRRMARTASSRGSTPSFMIIIITTIIDVCLFTITITIITITIIIATITIHYYYYYSLGPPPLAAARHPRA